MSSKPLILSISNDRRLITVMLLILLVTSFILFKVHDVMFSPNYVNKANLFLMAKESRGLNSLEEHIDSLDDINSNIEDYTFADIKASISKTIYLVNQTNKELRAQYDAWTSVKGVMVNDKQSFQKLQEQLRLIQEVNSKQILAIKATIDEASLPSLLDNFVSYIISFFMGIGSSVIATIVYKKAKG